MVKEGYRNTSIGVIPDNWKVERLSDVGQVTGGNTPRRSTDEYWGGDIPWLTPSQLTGKLINEISETDEYITEKGFENSSVKLLPPGTVIMSSRATIGETVINKVPMTTNQGFANIICDENKVYNYYLLYLLRYITPRLEALAGGSTFLEISRTNVRSVNIPVPSLLEQKKIASILLSVDKSIEKTSEVIEETKELKKGLMQALLTKGIGHSDFKDSQFGEIPKSWEINVMSYAAKINPRYKIPEKDEYLFLEMDSVNEHSPEVDGYEKREKNRCTNVKFKKGDVLFARITPSTENGKTALIENLEEEIAFGSTELIVLSPRKDLITSDYIYYLLKWSRVRNLAISMMEGSTGRQRVPREVFDGAIKIPLPPLEEQKQIASILSSVDAKIKKEEEYKAKLEKLKKGLMQKLLTGQIRVNTDMEV